MRKTNLGSLAAALGLVLLAASVSAAGLWMPGGYQTAGGYGTDWTPANSPMLTDTGGGLYKVSLMGLTAATNYNFKILDDGGTPPPAWGDPEVPNNGGGSPDNWFHTDASGSATINVNRNTFNDGLLPATDRITVNTDLTAFTTFYATGDWMIDAGGATNYNPADPLFTMTGQGSGLYSVDLTIPTPGVYQYKATAGSFANQWGANGRNVNASTLSFFTVADDQEVTFLLDVAKGAIGFSTDTFLAGDTDNDGMVEFEHDFFPIRDNWLEQSFLRAEGNLDNTGASEGIVDITDFRQWKNACALTGCATPAMIGGAFASLGAGVPEPSSAALALVAGLALIAAPRGRRHPRIVRSGTTS
jgi:hypothetical protein